MKDIEQLLLRVKSITGESQFEGAEKFAYQNGFDDAVAMMYIELVGNHKATGFIDNLLETQALALEGRINTTENDSHAHDPARAYEEGWNDANQQAADHLRAQKIGALQDNK